MKILHLEDLPADARSTEIALQQSGLQFDLLLVTNKKDFAKGLAEFKADIVLSGHSLPDINSQEALRLTKLHVPAIPFILLTSTVSGEHAVEIMREGAYDYVQKDRLKRLPNVIESAIEQWTHENERRRCMEQIVANEARYRQIIETAQEGIWMLDPELKTTFVNQRLCEILEYSSAEMIGRVLSDFLDVREKKISNTDLEKSYRIEEDIDVSFLTKNEKKIWACLSVSPCIDQHKNFNGTLIMFTNVTNKKLVEEKLRQRNNLLRTLIDNVPDYIFVKDLQSRHLINNKANIDLLGFQTEEETLGKSVADLIPGAESDEFLKDDLQILKSGIPIINKEESITTRTGEKQWVLTTKIPLKDEAGVITGLVGISRNITERKQISEKLAAIALKDISDRMIAMEEIEKLSFVARKTDNSVMITDAEQKIEWINESFTRMTGYTLEEVKGLKSGFLRGKETDIAMVKWMNSKVYHSEPFSGELINYSKTGRKYWLKLEISPVFNDDGKLKNFISIQSDITPQKEFESKITAIARELSSLIENANVPIFGVDRNGFINEWNHVSSELSGFLKSELFGRRWIEELVGPENRLAADQMIASVLDGNPVSNFELTVFTKNRKRLILLLSASPRRDSEKIINGAILVAQDITELIEYRGNLEKMVQDRTRELNEALQKEKDLVNMKSKFVSIASHEFRTPLSTITLAVGFLKKFKKDITAEEIDTKLSNIEKQVSHMIRLLDDVLMIGKAEAGKIPVRLVSINVLEFFERLCGEIEQSTARTHKIRLLHCLQVPVILSDEKLLRNIVINTLTNAIKFSPKADHVDVTVQSNPDKLSFQIRDYGIGIPPDDMKQLFEPFHRGSNVNAIQGTGLGLSIIKKGVDLLHGFIDVKSKVGTGTELNVILPAMHE